MPVIIKREEGARVEFSHLFYICTTEKALKNALMFEGFRDCEILIQEYIEHSE